MVEACFFSSRSFTPVLTFFFDNWVYVFPVYALCASQSPSNQHVTHVHYCYHAFGTVCYVQRSVKRMGGHTLKEFQKSEQGFKYARTSLSVRIWSFLETAILWFTSCCSLILIDLAMNFTEKWLHMYMCIMALSLLPFSHQSPTVALSSSLSSQFFCHCDTWTMRPLPPGNLHVCKCTQFFVNRIFSTVQISLQLARVAA